MSYRPDMTEAVVLPVISAAVAAYFDLEINGGKADNIYRQPLAGVSSVWALRGRELLMDRRQQITVWREKGK
ncbi:MAG: hypothetical protein DDT21_02002 [Syntrophomonadaceae bacterium]|nr:hypothetical protein [Bacillota bacterium]